MGQTKTKHVTLRELREQLGVTQADLAPRLEMPQPKVSAFERREDHKLSLIRRYVEALGGELEIWARVGEKRVRLSGG